MLHVKKVFRKFHTQSCAMSSTLCAWLLLTCMLHVCSSPTGLRHQASPLREMFSACTEVHSSLLTCLQGKTLSVLVGCSARLIFCPQGPSSPSDQSQALVSGWLSSFSPVDSVHSRLDYAVIGMAVYSAKEGKKKGRVKLATRSSPSQVSTRGA